MCGILSWFMLTMVFEILVDFFLFLRKNLYLYAGFLCYTVVYRGLHTRVALLDIQVQYASCPCTQLRTSLEIGIFGLGFACPCPFLILVC